MAILEWWKKPRIVAIGTFSRLRGGVADGGTGRRRAAGVAGVLAPSLGDGFGVLAGV